MKRFALLLLPAVFLAAAANACTTFVLQDKDRVYFGRNLDWHWEDGLVMVNQRHVKKTAVVQPGSPAAHWTSKFGSVTFNQFGQESPYGGMNEAGLVVENMWLEGTQYPAPDSRPAIGLLQWIQYQLDNCATVAEVIATDEKIRLEAPQVAARVHYLVCDASGDCASFECLNGKMICHHGKDFPLHALANETYEHSVAFAQQHPEAKGAGAPKSRSSDARFCHAGARVADFHGTDPRRDVAYAFDTLEEVSAADFTVWRMVYDVSERRIHFRTRSNPDARTINLKSLDFSCGHPIRCADIQAKSTTGGMPEFHDLSAAAQRQYLLDFCGKESVKKLFGDLSRQAEGQLMIVQTYTCDDK